MSFAAERQAIESRFASAWASATPVKYENALFEPPTNAPWVALHILQADAQPGSLKSSTQLHLHRGVIVVQVFVPEESGTAAALTLADNVAAIFRSVEFAAGSGPIACFSPTLRKVGPQDGWFQINVNAEYLRQFFS